MHMATDGEILVAATICRVDTPGGMLLYGSGYVDGVQHASPCAETEAAVSIGVDSLSSELRLLDQERVEDGVARQLDGLSTDQSAGDESGAVDSGRAGGSNVDDGDDLSGGPDAAASADEAAVAAPGAKVATPLGNAAPLDSLRGSD